MSTVKITVTEAGVTIKGVSGGEAKFDLDRSGAWMGGVTDKNGTVRLLAIARDGESPVVRHYTADGDEDFPKGWKFTDDEPGVTVIKTAGEAHLLG